MKITLEESASAKMRGGFIQRTPPKEQAPMCIEDIPHVESIVLSGLDFSMNPVKVRFEADKGFIKGFPEKKVKHIIKCLAIMVYNQEMFTALYHDNICDVRNPLAFFLCAVHRQEPRQPKRSHSRHNSNTSQMAVSDGNGNVSCRSPSRNGKKQCELPKLSTDSMLPLGNWDALYYALVAEIHKLHSDLQERFGFGCENGTEPLHYRGSDGIKREPITAIDLASLLETAWYQLMDHRLVATLDDTVRRKNFQKQQATENVGSGETPPKLYGMIDVNALEPDDIIQLLWDKYRAEVDQACLENFEDESMLSGYGAKQYAKLIEDSLEEDAPLSSPRLCKCHRACVCKLKCDDSAEGCTCNHSHVYHKIDEEDETGTIIIKYVKEDPTNPRAYIGTSSNMFTQMLPPTTATPTPATAMPATSHDVTDRSNNNGGSRSISTRGRANTNNSDLAYVPDAPSTRSTKDAYPLGFYGRGSGHRYPSASAPGTASSSRRPSTDQATTPFNGAKVPCRKPVPPPITPTSAAPNPFYYPAVPKSQSQNMFTQSFPADGAVHARDARATYKESDKASKANGKAVHHPANDYIGLLAEHPSAANEQYCSDTEPFPKLARSVTSSPPKNKSAKVTYETPNLKHANTTAGAVPTIKSFDTAVPQISKPDFIAPKPAVKQRYVSAGGDIPLSERVEIPGPAFFTTTPSPPSGRGITKEELDAKMSDPEWVRRNFGEDAVVAMCTPPRGSVEEHVRDSKEGSKRNSGRKSGDSDREALRDRTSSSASKRERLKRLFSRQNSINETD